MGLVVFLYRESGSPINVFVVLGYVWVGGGFFFLCRGISLYELIKYTVFDIKIKV